MSSNRASTSRLSLEEWDSLAPLSSLANLSVSRIQQQVQHKPLPTHLTLKQHPGASSSRPDTPSSSVLRSKGSRLDLAALLHSPSSSPRPASRAKLGPSPGSDHQPPAVNGTSLGEGGGDQPPLGVLKAIETTQEFHDWFGRVEHSMEREQEDIYREHLAHLERYISNCDTVLEQLDDARGLLSEMEANYSFVEDNSRALQLACETMLDEQKHLIEVTEAIGSRLEYFRELEKATKMLNLPGENLVLEDDFLNMLDRLDVCLDYLKANRDFKDAEIYIIRFQQCLTRSMTLIKMYFVSVIRQTTAEVGEKMGGKELSETASNALLYAKFSNQSEPLRVLVFELEKRARIEPREYGSLLHECYSAWFTARASLLAAPLAEEVRRMEPGATELIKLARAGCNHLRSISVTEWALYNELFTTGERELYAFLESLCDYLYDSLRPRILHEARIDALCELCTVITAMMALDIDSGAGEDDSDVDDTADDDEEGNTSTLTIPGHAQPSPGPGPMKGSIGRLRFSVLLETILQDTQTRLVFRAQAVIQSEVLHYVPSAEDLAYPEKLAAAQGGQPQGLALWTEDEALRGQEIGGFKVPREEVQANWYPTLKRTVWVLSKLNTYVKNAIFEDFAGEAVALCRQSLSTAAGLVGARTAESGIDGQLFLIRHLLLLKEMIRSVDLVQVERAADFSTVTEALINLLRNTSVLFNPNALFELASKGIPTFAETMTDAKTDLDGALKAACEQLINDSSAKISSQISAFLDRCTAFLSSANGVEAGSDLPGQTWASNAAVRDLHDQFQHSLEREARAVVDKLQVYLTDEKTVGVLLPPLLAEIADRYSTFYNLVRSEYDFATSSSLETPQAVQDKLAAATKQ